MVAETIPLFFAEATTCARLHEMTGRDERAVSGIGTGDAIQLLDALLDNSSTQREPRLCAADLVAADRDRLLAAVYERAFGDRIESTLGCARCAQPFELCFSLSELTKSILNPRSFNRWRHLGDGRYETAAGVPFRIPTGSDELAVASLSSKAAESSLLSHCAESDAWPGGANAFEEMLNEVAPLLAFELKANCPECGHSHTLQFDIQSYLLGAIVGERRRLLAEIHRLAAAYAWSLDEILSLTRSDRRQFVKLIENETSRKAHSLR